MASSLQKPSSEDIRRSIEALDQVIDEFDGPRVPNTAKSRGYLENEKNSYANLIDPVKQSLDILDTVLAQFEDYYEENTKEFPETSKKTNLDDIPTRSRSEEQIPSKIDARQEHSPKNFSSNENLASPQHSKKVSPPPVPKRSPTTCLSCSSSTQFDLPSPEADQNISASPNFPITNRDSTKDQITKTIDSERKLTRRKGRLSSKPVQKGNRPQLKSNDTPASQDDNDISDEDDVFQQIDSDSNADDLINQNRITEQLTKTTEDNETIMNKLIGTNEKFAFGKYLLKSGQLIGLDEKPPNFCPPPPPTKNKNSSAKPNNNDINRKQKTTNDDSKDVKQTEFLNNPVHHVTSVKILQPSVPHTNISVITIQPTTPPGNNNSVNPAAMLREKETVVKTAVEQRPSLSTFTARHGGSAASSKSSSLEDMVGARFTASDGAAAASQAAKTGLELNKEATKGAVFFNIYQCPSSDGEKNKKSKENLNEKTDGEKKLRKKKKKSSKEKEEPKDTTSKKSAEKTALMAELEGKMKKTAPATEPSSDEESPDDGSRSNQATTPTHKEDKKHWKGLWKK